MRPDWLDRTEYPFASHYFETKEGRMHYVDEGEGPAIVMLHGNPAWSFAYRNVIKGLAPSARCIALDHLGFGLSDKPMQADYSPQAHARRASEFIESLGLPQVTLMVQDWGGPIGLSYAVEHPERVSGIVVMNTWMWSVAGDPHFERFSRMMGGPLGQMMIKRFNLFVNVVMPKAVADRRRSLPPRVLRHYRNALPDPDARRACAALPGHILGAGPWLQSLWERRERLRGRPMLVLWGEQDIAFRAKELDRWRTAFPEAEQHSFADAGHYVQEEKSAAVAALVQQWSSSRQDRGAA